MQIEKILVELYNHNFHNKNIHVHFIETYPIVRFENPNNGRVAIVNCDTFEVKMYYEDGNMYSFTINSIDDMNRHIFS